MSQYEIKIIQELRYVQKELREIDLIGRSFYENTLHTQKSISENFRVSYRPNLTMSLWADSELLADYPVRKMKEYEKPQLSEEGKNKVLMKIQLRNPNFKK